MPIAEQLVLCQLVNTERILCTRRSKMVPFASDSSDELSIWSRAEMRGVFGVKSHMDKPPEKDNKLEFYIEQRIHHRKHSYHQAEWREPCPNDMTCPQPPAL
ncbi:hypothetical protein PAXRUDRAFT_834167 [Paxillus rubicundulus Ve08.2h10]|uniref:Uncharacterized protein n=1 Tax=Paxillus rubicundulus Ve08.2h10 TaxID=930991 RepID=A0A0D0CV43_9AGAM|nr:hypothetical protein PAXRUDRAFT_834167 [Paxillus rubicundulus Ve08.2h10]